MKKLNPLLLLTVLLTACTSMPSKPITWQSANQAIVKEHIIPRYQQLADASIELEKQSQALCASPSQANLEKTQQAFHQTMDGWIGIQHIRQGPVELLNRYHRFQFWPDKHNTGSKQLGKLLAEQDRETLQADHFARSSVAVQGLTTMERLLFSQNKGIETFGVAGNPSYHCLLVEAITHNLATMSAELVEDWSIEPVPFHTLFLSSGQLLGKRMKDKTLDQKVEVTTVFFNNLYTQVQSVIDQKLLRPMGEEFSKAKPRYTESWRSERSLRNIKMNLQALESLYDTGFAPAILTKQGGTELNIQIKQAFKATLAEINTINQRMHKILEDESQRPVLEQLVSELRQLQSLLTGPLPQTLEIPMGFNALDGD